MGCFCLSLGRHFSWCKITVDCIVWLTIHAQRVFSMRQWGWVLLLRSSVSLFFAQMTQMVEITLTDVVGKASRMLALFRGIDFGVFLP